MALSKVAMIAYAGGDGDPSISMHMHGSCHHTPPPPHHHFTNTPSPPVPLTRCPSMKGLAPFPLSRGPRSLPSPPSPGAIPGSRGP